MPSLASQVLYEDNHLLIVNKLAGQLVQGDATGDTPLVELMKGYIGEKYNKPGAVYLGVVHRLDRPTSGVVVFARTSKALTRLNAAFKERHVQKTYHCIVSAMPTPKSGDLEHYLLRNPKQNKSYPVITGNKEAKLAKLSYRTIKSSDRYHLLEVDLHTGRHHQIRAQLAAVGSVIKGDLKYGAKRSNKDGSICLHARSITLDHPVKKEPLTVVAPYPEDNLWRAMGKG